MDTRGSLGTAGTQASRLTEERKRACEEGRMSIRAATRLQLVVDRNEITCDEAADSLGKYRDAVERKERKATKR